MIVRVSKIVLEVLGALLAGIAVIAGFIAYRLAYKGHRATRYSLPPTWRPVVSRLEKVLVKYRAPN